jgi:hypothetical protein
MAEFKQLEGAAAKTKFALEKAFLPAAAALGGLAVLGGKAAKAASDLSEAQSASSKVFGQSSKEVEKFSKTAAKNLGQSQRQATEAATTFALFGKSAGLSGQQLVDFSTKFVTLASDMASFKNTTPEEAITAIGAAFRGETEPIRKYNVLLDDASLRQEALKMGLIATTKQALTPQQKVLAASNLIMAQTVDLQGDFTDTADGLANSQRQLTATMEDFQASLGKALLPIIEKILPLLERMASWAANNPAAFQTIAVVIGAIATSVIAANVAMKTWNAVTSITDALNTKLGVSFRRLHTALGIVGTIATVAVTTYAILKNAKDDLKRSTDSLADALAVEGDAQRQILKDLTKTDGSIRQLLKQVDALGFSFDDLRQYIVKGTGPLELTTEQVKRLAKNSNLSTFEFAKFVTLLDKTRQQFLQNAEAINLVNGALGAEGIAKYAPPAAGRLLEIANRYKELKFGTDAATKSTEKFGDSLRKAFVDARRNVADVLAGLRKNISDTISNAITSGINFGAIQTAAKEAGTTFMAGLAESVAKAKIFADRLQQLLRAGLSQDAVAQVAQAGADAGTLIADELLAGGAATIGQANDLVAAAQKAAIDTGTLAGATYYNEGTVLAQQLTKGITDVISKYKIKLSSPGLTEKQLNRLRNRFAIDVDFVMSQVPALAQGGIVSSPTLALIGEAGPEAVVPLDKMGQMGNVTINVNGGDPQAVVDALRRYMQINGSVPIRVS